MAANKRPHRVVLSILFVLYFILLFYLLFFSETMGRSSGVTYRYNLVPFREIMRFWNHRHSLGFYTVALNLVGNVAAFLPFGVLVPVFFPQCRRVTYTTLYSLELSLVVETIQLITKVGTFDVDDLILNTLGGLLGFLIYQIWMHFWRKRNDSK